MKQRPKVKDKIIWTPDLIEEIDRVPETYLQHMQDGLYEVQVNPARSGNGNKIRNRRYLFVYCSSI